MYHLLLRREDLAHAADLRSTFEHWVLTSAVELYDQMGGIRDVK